MKPLILLYNVNQGKLDMLKSALAIMGISIKCLDKSQLSCRAGALAYPDLFEADCSDEAKETSLDKFSEEFMLLCGVDRAMIDKVLNFMNKKKINISLKAMLTETNKDWSMSKLISEIKAERDEIAKIKNK